MDINRIEIRNRWDEMIRLKKDIKIVNDFLSGKNRDQKANYILAEKMLDNMRNRISFLRKEIEEIQGYKEFWEDDWDD